MPFPLSPLRRSKENTGENSRDSCSAAQHGSPAAEKISRYYNTLQKIPAEFKKTLKLCGSDYKPLRTSGRTYSLQPGRPDAALKTEFSDYKGMSPS
jgi:hypothetical protein